MKLLLLIGLTVVISGCDTMTKIGGNNLGVTYNGVTLSIAEKVYPNAKKHCAQYSKTEKLVQKVNGTYIFECI